MAIVKPRLPDKKHTFKQEVDIADKDRRKSNAIGYVFSAGRRVFIDKVDKDGY